MKRIKKKKKTNKKIHMCIIINGKSKLNQLNKREKKRHEYRLLLFYDKEITRKKNYINFELGIKLKYFYNHDVIKISSLFYIHTFDFVLISEQNLVYAILCYFSEKWKREEDRTIKKTEEKKRNKNDICLLVDEMVEQLNLVTKKVINNEGNEGNEKNNSILTLNFEKMKTKFQLSESDLLQFKKYVLKNIKHQKNENLEKQERQERQDSEQTRNRKEVDINEKFKFTVKDIEKNKREKERVIQFIWVYKILEKLSNNIDYDFIDFLKKQKLELSYNYIKADIETIENEEYVKKKNEEYILRYKNYTYELNENENFIYLVLSNDNTFSLKINIESNHFIVDYINKLFHFCLNNLIIRNEWKGIDLLIKECESNGNYQNHKYFQLNLLNKNCAKKLKHISAGYQKKEEDYFYIYIMKILEEKSNYCLNIKKDFCIDFLKISEKEEIEPKKCFFGKFFMYSNNRNLYKDKIKINLNKSEKIFHIEVTSNIGSLHICNDYKLSEKEEIYIFINCLYVRYEILKNFRQINRNEKKESIEQICKCFDEILKPYELILYNSSNLKKKILWSWEKVEFDETEVTDSSEKIHIKSEDNDDKICSDFSDTDNKASNIDYGIEIEEINNVIDKKERKLVNIYLEKLLHKQGKLLFKIRCSYWYYYVGTDKKKELTEKDEEKWNNKFYFDFFISVNILKPYVTLFYNNQTYLKKIIKFEFCYFNKKAYKRIEKMYSEQLINDIMYSNINEINEYFDHIFLKSKNFKLNFMNQQDITIYLYIYTKSFFTIKSICIDDESMEYSKTKLYTIRNKGHLCIELEIDDTKFKIEKKKHKNQVCLYKKMEKTIIYEDSITFQHLTETKVQNFPIECHYKVPYLIMKENQFLFQQFNNLEKQNQEKENIKELIQIENNISDKLKKRKIQFNELEMENDKYFIKFCFSEIKIFKFCLFLFNVTEIPATWQITENLDKNAFKLKNSEKIFHFSKTKDILFGKTYDVNNMDINKKEKKENPFLFPDYIIVTFRPSSKSDVIGSFCLNISESETIPFVIKGIYTDKK